MGKKLQKIKGVIPVEPTSIKYFIISWIIIAVILSIRLILLIIQYTDYQNNPLLIQQPKQFSSIPFPYFFMCAPVNSYYISNASCLIGSTPVEFQYNVIVGGFNCTIFNSDQSAVSKSVIDQFYISLSVTNDTVQNSTGLYLVATDIMYTSTVGVSYTDLLLNAITASVMELSQRVKLDSTIQNTYDIFTNTLPIATNSLVFTVRLKSLIVNQFIETSPLMIFDIISGVGGVFSILMAIYGFFFVSIVPDPKKKFAFVKNPSQY